MTCPYFSKLSEVEIFCQVYGPISVSGEKMAECHSNYSDCLEVTKRHLDNEARMRGVLVREFSGIDDLIDCVI